MTTYIALLRGINFGGHNTLPMKDLSALLTDMGLRDVQTYIQSGNAVFRSAAKDRAALAAKISAAIKARFGFGPQVWLLDAAELREAMSNNPYPEAVTVPASLHLLFLAEVPSRPDLKGLKALCTGTERFTLKDKVFYLHAPDGVGRSRLVAHTEKLLGVAATGRNWNTVRKLVEMTS